MVAKLIYLTDREFELLVKQLRFGSVASDSINIENKLMFMRDKFKGKDEPKLTREEAIKFCAKSFLLDGNFAGVIDFFIDTGMLEVKEDNPTFLSAIHSKLIKDIGVSIPIITLGQILAIIVEMGYEIKAINS